MYIVYVCVTHACKCMPMLDQMKMSRAFLYHVIPYCLKAGSLTKPR